MRWLTIITLLAACAQSETRTQQGVSLRPGNHSLSFRHGVLNREYLLHVPPSYTGMPMPLVINLHGGGLGTAEQQNKTSGMLKKADEAGFLVAAPEGISKTWNAG